METKAHYALVGFFALALLAAGVVFAVWLGQIRVGERFATYDVIFEGPVRGLAEQSEVRFNGIKVGEVVRLGLKQDDPSRVVARVRVQEDTPVREDSVAKLEPQGLTGLSYIQITAGETGAMLWTRGGGIPVIRSEKPQLESIFEAGETVVGQLTEFLRDENIAKLEAIVTNVETLTGDLAADGKLAERLNTAVERMESAAINIDKAALDIQAFAAEGERVLVEDITPMVEETDRASREVAVAAADAADIAQSLKEPIARFAVEGLDELSVTISELRGLIATLDGVARELEADPAAFVSGETRREVEVPR